MLRCTLQGGLATPHGLMREARLRPLSTGLEVALADASLETQCWPQFVTRVLAASVLSLEDGPFSEDTASALCVADRDWLMLHLARQIDGDAFWFTATCTPCRARFDLHLRRSALPRKAAGAGYPQVRVALDSRSLEFRLPNGSDQVAVARSADTEDPVQQVLRRCLQAVDGAPAAAQVPWIFDTAAIDAIDAEMDIVAPDLGRRLMTSCPECGCEQVVDLGTSGLLPRRSTGIYEEIRRLAHHCHWSEADIVAMPRTRRQHYLRLVDEAASAAHVG